MKVVVDMNLSPRWTAVLREAGHEAMHWSAVGDPGASDTAIMEWAAAGGYVVFTHDLDFGALLAATAAQAPSVFQVRTQDVLPESLAASVLAALEQFREHLEAGALISIDEHRARVRILPFPS
ncbi:MAG: hypothetical protein GVY18_10090 [Bacteroidetes bacterium]|jgi:predicted nuclease of predicted toxin-antitoxin system|nr:hypothetical protein [Bacteroidota bacterium]